jgi:hypothetical protein
VVEHLPGESAGLIPSTMEEKKKKASPDKNW